MRITVLQHRCPLCDAAFKVETEMGLTEGAAFIETRRLLSVIVLDHLRRCLEAR